MVHIIISRTTTKNDTLKYKKILIEEKEKEQIENKNYTSVIILNVNGLIHTLCKRLRLSMWINL